MRKLIVLIIAAIAFATGTASANMIASSATAVEAKTTDSGLLRYHSFEPCNFWRYVTGGNAFGYLCVSPGMAIDVPDAFEVDRVLREYENRIETLEQRLESLEKKLEARE